jgi:broad specificity phosphatase PhoE
MEPDTSPDFTVEDIHKIREWNYQRLKDATRDERIADTRKRIAPLLAELQATHTRSNDGIRQTVTVGAI